VAAGSVVVGVILHDEAKLAGLVADPAPSPDDPAPPFIVGVTRLGRIQRLPLEAYVEESNRTGRRFARLDKDDSVLIAGIALGGERISLATKGGNVLVFPLREAPALRAAGKGTTAISLRDDDEVHAAAIAPDAHSGVKVTGPAGQTWIVSHAEVGTGGRGDAGKRLFRKGSMAAWLREPVVRVPERATPATAPSPSAPSEEGDE